ncbi:MAG TPA: 50S ribosomal protein L18 [Syntrophales bacterium]|nr:50S ribosomal protein L18 [Syntrophales bacterium]HOX95045.1 50S ribosomal protein L18 [Syntrophales bacterium]HPI57323.1 50S ribosomal protein L18 [Syntrophales bacterium]HPN25203.1 50S ribosomal protein L18 [Syntrophales bacterium]HQM29378.1 50S ribosomal protein L18 [Syntrophales bacterium]
MIGKIKKIKKVREKRKKRVRGKVAGTANHPRISVFRSAGHIYAQAVDDDAGRTVASASTLSKELKDKIGGMKKTQAAAEVGRLLAKRLKEKNIQNAVFDRGAFLYHGRVRALAEAAKEAGLKI